ncbi:YihY family inner membrane protein [Ramlibacter tataouinensis]|uniref:Candidate tRNA processing ribonuclease BN n=1 Tax=Ramlibacter tataouinensis (strain ATCC BAA-407 / DSM 14655 / LMG 21543 / TTB310) TaxID=365046 RepID=F5Y3Z0_RAMTT|nr:YihY family inner membrane protein [Ramlibacter tataouinensis]AEG91268.1 Candidate tRNA processing ribonuclease BN [Ramlibacter tataouinensis TTB310]
MINLLQLTVRRAREERLAQAAGSLTLTTVLSVVPLLAVSFALFSRIPAFQATGLAIRQHLLQGVLPPDIARTVLKHLSQFTANTGGLTWVGALFVVGSALVMLFSVENVLNRLWQVKKNRPVHQRLGLYAVMLALGPPLLGASLWATSYVLTASAGLIGTRSPQARLLLNLVPVLLGTLGLASLFYFVPNAKVRRRDAIVGGLLASIAFELGKRGFAVYLLKIPTYKTVYGAFAPVLLFLVWVYFSWLVTLAAALVSATLPRAGRQPAGRRLSRA